MADNDENTDDREPKTILDPFESPEQDEDATQGMDPLLRNPSSLEAQGVEGPIENARDNTDRLEVTQRSSSTAEFHQPNISQASLPTFFGVSDTEEIVPDEETKDASRLIGITIGGYKLTSILGEGGMSTVYLAQHQTLSRTAAIKVLAPQFIFSQIHKARFFQEAQIVNEVRHPNIVEIYDFIQTEAPTRIALIMEHLRGMPLSEAIRTNKVLKPAKAFRACYQICDAVAAVHERGVVHRDLKPDNIFLTKSLSSKFNYIPSLKVLDFGIAKDLVQPSKHKTKTGIAIGTPAYMAPEQISGAQSSEKCDVYAISSILYEMLTGHRLFSGDVQQILRDKLIIERPVLHGLEDLDRETEISALITWGLARDPKFRPSITDFTRGLLELEPEMVETLERSDTSFFLPRQLLTGEPEEETDETKSRSLASITSTVKLPSLIMLLLAGVVLVLAGFDSLKKPIREPSVVQLPASTEGARPEKAVTRIGRMVQTEPAGALVINAQSREVLGSTPVTLELKPGQQMKLELRKKGFEKEVLVVNTRRSLETIRLKAKTRRKNPKLRRPKKVPKKIKTKVKPPKKTKAPYQRGEMPGWD